MGSGTVEDSPMGSGPAGTSPVKEDSAATVRSLNLFDGLVLLIALALGGVGFLIGTAGGPPTGSTTSVEFTVNPEDQVRPLAPGATATLPIYIKNPNSYGVRVDSISEGKSLATASGCPAGTITSAQLDSPVGFIRADGIRTYELFVTMAATTDSRCKAQSFTLPLTVTLATAATDR